MSQPSRSRFLISFGLVVLAGCAVDSLTLPSDGEPATVAILDGDAQQGIVGQPLTNSLMIRVSDGSDRPVVNQVVSFIVTVGGVVAPGSVTTDNLGKAQFTWKLGTTSGTQVLEVGVSASGRLAPKTTFNAMAQPGSVERMVLVRGDGLTAQVNHAVADSLVVRLDDEYGNPVGGKDVTWHTTSGSLSRATVTTGQDGRAAVLWTLGGTIGPQAATAEFATVTNSPVTFAATATQGPPPQLAMVTEPSSAAASGQIFVRQPSVRLEDDLGNPIARSGVQVTAAVATGGGTLGGTTTVVTNSNGLAQFTDLRISASSGNHTLIFAASGHTAITSSVITIASPAPSAQLSTLSASPATVAPDEIVTITVTARDGGGTPISGQSVTISVSGNGNTINQPAGPTNANGVATAMFYSDIAETKTVSARIGGTSINQTASVTITNGGTGAPSPAHTTAHVPKGKRLRVTTITIISEDAFGNPLRNGGFAGQFSVTVTGTNQATPNVTDQGDGTYTASYLPVFKGHDQIDIRLNGVPIKGSPYTSQVK